tara:strand:+ start:7607 stop:8458 length:852 start_codon:yes stop_codon:yes gene_type:complete
MKYSNVNNLPDVFAKAVVRDTYSRGKADISATGLLKPPRQAHLAYQHDDQIVVDVSKQVWSLFGRAVHHILELGTLDGYILEQRYFAQSCGWTVSGQIDVQRLDPQGITIMDWKTRKAYAVMNGRRSDVEQLNIYAWLARKNGREVSQLQIVNIIRDHSSFEAERNPDYPQSEVTVTDIDLWTFAEQEEFVRERVEAHQLSAITLPDCTDEERWKRPDKFAVIKTGGKRAFKLYTNQRDAEDFVEEHEDYIIEHRKGEAIRCAKFCDVSAFCDQYQGELNGND